MSSRYLLDRLAGRDPSLRAGDADRERIADRLRVAHTEGRIDLAEFQQRLERCYESKTFGELDQLVRDLPFEQQPARRSTSAPGWTVRLAAMATIVAVLSVLVAVSAGPRHQHFVWVWIPLMFLVWRMVWWRRGRRIG
jgi:hypothetical protein